MEDQTPRQSKPTSKPIEATWWTTFNPDGSSAVFVATRALRDLPAGVRAAILLVPKNHRGLDPEAVNWNVTCVNAAGNTVIRDMVFIDGGSRSGAGCGENDLWATTPEGSAKKRNVPIAAGSSYFTLTGCIYVIDGGLCPCRRCCKSFLALATRLESTIIVRPMVDYELIKRARTELDPEQTFLLVARPGAEEVIVYHSAVDEAPWTNDDRNVANDPDRAWFVCSNPKCNMNFTMQFLSAAHKDRVIQNKKVFGASQTEHPVFECPNCKNGHLALVYVAKGDWPARRINAP